MVKASRVLASVFFCLVCLIILFSQSFRCFLFCFGWQCSIDLLVRQSISKFLNQFFELCFRTCPAMFFYFFQQIFVSSYPDFLELTFSMTCLTQKNVLISLVVSIHGRRQASIVAIFRQNAGYVFRRWSFLCVR